MIRGFIFLLAAVVSVYGQNSECLDCHSDAEFTTERNGEEISLFVNETKFNASVHAELECIDCHEDYDGEEIPHNAGNENTAVDCSNCHEIEYDNTPHLQKNQCFQCHSKHEVVPASELTAERQFCVECHKSGSVKNYYESVHFSAKEEGKNGADCQDCHTGSVHDINAKSIDLYSACGSCHETVVAEYKSSLHGKAIKQRRKLAPNCTTCHGYHKILSYSDENSQTYKMNIPQLCGNCHKDGTKVSEIADTKQRHILENYSQSIHGDGLFKRGLIVSAACSDCHTAHKVLPHTDPNSSINRNRIASTCTKCHAQIEKVHVKVIEGKLWEEEPKKIPACVDCHQPHIIRRVVYEEKYTDDYCMSCHGNENLKVNKNGKEISLFVDYAKYKNSVHKKNSCIKCHSNIDVGKKIICMDSGKVDCAACHAENVEDYNSSIHGKMFLAGQRDAPYCTDCHGTHYASSKNDVDSPTARKNIPMLCAKCHREGEKAAVRYEGPEHNIISNYSMSIHGKGLLESGLMVSATCIDCHTSHKELPIEDPNSSINKKNLPKTCAKCHLGIYEQFRKSIHSEEISKSTEKLPSCYDCHQSHTIERVDQKSFRQDIIDQCGQCHWDVTETYFDTFHGKVSKLGETAAAKCYDCHGSHQILPPDDPNSTLSRQNIIATCASCHPNSNRKFVGYLTHATHHDKDKYPYLYYTYLFMTILLVSTFLFFGLHTILWLPRALKEKRKKNKK